MEKEENGFLSETIEGWKEPCLDMSLELFAIKRYLTGKRLEDEFTEMIIDSKKTDLVDYFYADSERILKSLISLGRIPKIDLICLIPKHDADYSPTLQSLCFRLSKLFNVKYEVIFKNEKTERKNTGNKKRGDRFDKVKDSLKIKRYLNDEEKNVLIIDDQKTTGSTLIWAKKLLLDSGAKNIFAFCLGINHNPEFFGKRNNGYKKRRN